MTSCPSLTTFNQENADVEWKFATASMWMQFMGEGGVVPPPFNIVPSVESITNWLAGIRRKCLMYYSAKWRQKDNEIKVRLFDI